MNKRVFDFALMTLVVCLFLPSLSQAQSKNVVTAHRVFPKIDKVLEFENVVAAHAQKYHTGEVTWRIFEIKSGPDAGGYHITEGPTSWEALDTRGNLGDEHHKDWHKNVAMYLTDRQSVSFSVYEDTLSTIALGDFSTKINITHIYPKPGCDNQVRKIISNLRKVWQKNGVTVAVYTSSSSGPSQFTLVTRYKQGLKEKAQGFRPPFKGVYESIFGEDSLEAYFQSIRDYVNTAWSELLVMRPDLSSKL